MGNMCTEAEKEKPALPLPKDTSRANRQAGGQVARGEEARVEARVENLRNSQKQMREEVQTLRREKVPPSNEEAEKIRVLEARIKAMQEEIERSNRALRQRDEELESEKRRREEQTAKSQVKSRELEVSSQAVRMELEKSIREKEKLKQERDKEAQDRQAVLKEKEKLQQERDQEAEGRLAVLKEKEETERKQKQMEEQLKQEKLTKEKIQGEKLQLERERNSSWRKYETLQKDKQQLATTVSFLKQSQSDSQQHLNQIKLALRLSTLFNFGILAKQEDYKQFLVGVLERHLSRSIRETELVYHFDPQNKINVHKYIDNHPYFVILIALKNGFLLAGYSEGGFIPKQVSDKDGLLISLTNRKVFLLAEKNRRAVTYDDFYIIMGNSELRVKSQDELLFSNFGISNGYFNARGEKVSVVMGGGLNDRELPMQSYECYALKLHDTLQE